MHQKLIICFWVKQETYEFCFFHVALRSTATLLETHFLEAKMFVDSNPQNAIRTVTRFLQLWLCNTSIYVCWLTHEQEHSSVVESQPLYLIHQMCCYLRVCGTITHHLDKWCVTVHVRIFHSCLFGQSHLNNSSDPFFCPHVQYSCYFGVGLVHGYKLLHLYKLLMT
jgi:hypothetical protein